MTTAIEHSDDMTTTTQESTFTLGNRGGVQVVLDTNRDEALGEQIVEGFVALAGESGLDREEVRNRVRDIRAWLGETIHNHPGVDELLIKISPPPSIEFESVDGSLRVVFTHELDMRNMNALWNQLNAILEEQPRMTPEQLQALASSIRTGLQVNGIVLDPNDLKHEQLETMLKMLEAGKIEMVEEKTPEKEGAPEAQPTYEEKILGRILRIQTLVVQTPPDSALQRAQWLAELGDIEQEVAENDELKGRKLDLRKKIAYFQAELRDIEAGNLNVTTQNKNQLLEKLTTAQRELDEAEDIDRMIQATRDHEHAKDPRVQVHLVLIHTHQEPRDGRMQNLLPMLDQIDEVPMEQINDRNYQLFVERLAYVKELAETSLRKLDHTLELLQAETEGTINKEQEEQIQKVNAAIALYNDIKTRSRDLEEKLKDYATARAERQNQIEEQAVRIRLLLRNKFASAQ